MRRVRESTVTPKRSRGWWQSFTTVVLLVAPVLAICIASVDAHVVAWFAKRDLPGDLEKALQLSEAFAHGSGVIVIFSALLLIDRSKHRQIVSVLLMVVVIMILANSAKTLVSRARPYTFDDLAAVGSTWFPSQTKEGWETGIRSFPSGHSATAAAMAFALCKLYPRGRYLFVFVAVLACLQRIASRAHYPTDVLAGVTIAAFVALVWERLFPMDVKATSQVESQATVSSNHQDAA